MSIGVLGLTRVAGPTVAETRVRRPAGLVVAANTLVKVDFSTVDADALGAFSAAANTRLTVPAPGRYGLHASGQWSGRVFFYSMIFLMVNDAALAEELWSGDNGSDQLKQVCNRAVQLAAGDRIEMVVRHTDTGFTKTMTNATLALVRL